MEFEEPYVMFADGETKQYPEAELLDNGWVRVVEQEQSGSAGRDEYFSPHQIERVFE